MVNGSVIPENSPRGVVDWVPADAVVVVVVGVVAEVEAGTVECGK